MQKVTTIYDHPPVDKYLERVRVVGLEEDRNSVKVALTSRQGQTCARARLALPLRPIINPGDEVLVVGDRADNLYVIGILKPDCPTVDSALKIVFSDGAFASIKEFDNGQKLRVYSDRKTLMFEYDSNTGKCRMALNAKNVQIEALEGDIAFNAGKNIRLSGENIELTGRTGIELSVGHLFERIRSVFSLNPGKINISGQNLHVSAVRGNFFLEDVRNNIKKVFNKIEFSRIVIHKLETSANSIIEKAKNTYRTTQNLNQIKAGRMRMLINSTFHLKSKSSVLKAKDDVKVKSDKIHLG